MQVIVLDGHLKSSLAAVRSLGRAGYDVVVGSDRRGDFVQYSRYATEHFIYPNPRVDQAGFIAALLQAASGSDVPLPVLAFSDATHVSIYTAKTQVEKKILFPFVSPDAFDIAFNKAATYSEAKLLGIPVISTWLLDNGEEVKRRSREFTYPMVVKPRRSVAWQAGVATAATASFHFNAESVVERFVTLKEQTGEAPLVQSFVEGEEYGVELLVQNGEVVAETIHHRLRSLAPTGGASVLKETIGGSLEADAMRTDAYRLARTLAWTGPLMVEYKVEAMTQTPRLMEINGRFWGSLPLGSLAGVDYPRLYVELLRGTHALDSVVKAEPGVTSRHWLGDVQHLLRVLFARDTMRELLYPTRKKSLRDFFRVPPGTRGDVWSWRDPLPAIIEPVSVLLRKLWN